MIGNKSPRNKCSHSIIFNIGCIELKSGNKHHYFLAYIKVGKTESFKVPKYLIRQDYTLLPIIRTIIEA